MMDIESLVDPGDLVFDVGACVGSFTKRMLKLGAQVVAFEPSKRLASIISDLYPDAKVVPMAVADTNDPVEFWEGDCNTLGTCWEGWKQGRFKNHKWAPKAQVVDAITLDEAIAQYGIPHFVKIDVEGYEPNVVSGLTRSVPWLSFEYAHEFPGRAIRCLDHLGMLGMTQFYFAPGKSPHLNGPMEKGWLLDYLHGLGPLTWGDIYARRDDEA